MMEGLSLDELAKVIDGLEDVISKQRAACDDLKAHLLARLEAQGVTSTVTEEGRRITIVRSQTTSWDTEILKDILAPLGLWERVRVIREDVDDRALERLVDGGELSLDRLQSALSVNQRKAYPKITKTGRS
jgi:hypothetical protein